MYEYFNFRGVKMTLINIFIISDSSGETALTIAKTTAAQFTNNNVKYQRFSFIQSQSTLSVILNLAKIKKAMVFFTLVNQDLSVKVKSYFRENHIDFVDCIQPAIQAMAKHTGISPNEIPSLNHNLTDAYFKRIAAMEFAVTYDDGKDPTGLLKSDIVILGVSRTSKTPLSLFLANQGLNVSNLPLSPQLHVPNELWHIDFKKITGLTNNPNILQQIRQQRMLSYNLPVKSTYANTEKIKDELNYANDIYQKIGCLIINVANKSIEETAAIILENIKD